MLAFGAPEPSVPLQAARALGDDLTTSTLEGNLKRKQTSRVVLITSIFVGSGLMTFIAFASMGKSPQK
ncbi:hypothetical protein K239x_28700 [Planctomycetes bacterium K23_9]|uniref:Uncharacterized protein n=2 Tax=Stieleria marina TaxID=1930275 RepID=A0A517NUT0_9BACT|nr:hypothetical protein K239x_28700 [Planctomycetes bacterium K23_9]